MMCPVAMNGAFSGWFTPNFYAHIHGKLKLSFKSFSEILPPISFHFPIFQSSSPIRKLRLAHEDNFHWSFNQRDIDRLWKWFAYSKHTIPFIIY